MARMKRYKKQRIISICYFLEAAQLAKDGEAEALWLTHFSPSLNEPELVFRGCPK